MAGKLKKIAKITYMKLAIFLCISRREVGVQVSVVKRSCRCSDLNRQDCNYKNVYDQLCYFSSIDLETLISREELPAMIVKLPGSNTH